MQIAGRREEHHRGHRGHREEWSNGEMTNEENQTTKQIRRPE
jgi:hypothetical protein